MYCLESNGAVPHPTKKVRLGHLCDRCFGGLEPASCTGNRSRKGILELCGEERSANGRGLFEKRSCDSEKGCSGAHRDSPRESLLFRLGISKLPTNVEYEAPVVEVGVLIQIDTGQSLDEVVG